MKRLKITRSKFYAIRKAIKLGVTPKQVCERIDVVPSTITRVLKARNFQEYKLLGNLYSRLMKKLKRRVLFILGVLVVLLIILNLRWI